MNDTTKDVMGTVDSVLAGKELKNQPRALLLLRLCQLSLLFSPDKTEHYWSQLAPLQTKIPKEFQPNLEDIRSVTASRVGRTGKLNNGTVLEAVFPNLAHTITTHWTGD